MPRKPASTIKRKPGRPPGKVSGSEISNRLLGGFESDRLSATEASDIFETETARTSVRLARSLALLAGKTGQTGQSVLDLVTVCLQEARVPRHELPRTDRLPQPIPVERNYGAEPVNTEAPMGATPVGGPLQTVTEQLQGMRLRIKELEDKAEFLRNMLEETAKVNRELNDRYHQLNSLLRSHSHSEGKVVVSL